MIFKFRNFYLISLTKFYVTRSPSIVLSHKKDDEYLKYDFFTMSLKSVRETIFFAKINYGRAWSFSVSQRLMYLNKVIIFYCRKFAGSRNEVMLTIQAKQSLLIPGFSKISHHG